MRNLQLNSIRRPVKSPPILQIAGTLLAALIICSSEKYPTPYQPGYYPRAAPAGWWNEKAFPAIRGSSFSRRQKAYFYKGKSLVGESTVSTGKPGFSTPPKIFGSSKDADHVSSIFGDYVDDYGNVVRSNIDARKDRRPRGSHFDGAQMPYAMFFRGGDPMHQGYVPPFAASHGCIRLPGQMAPRFFENAPVGTSVTVTE